MKDFTLRHHNQRGYGVYTKKSWEKGEEILRYEGRIVPTYLSSIKRRLTLNAHFSFEWNKGSCFDYLNHSCHPSCYIDLLDGIPSLKALRNIASDEELSYNYNTIELDLCKNFISFPCHCGHTNCIGWIKGFMYLTPAQEKPILEMCTPFIKKMQAEYEKNRD